MSYRFLYIYIAIAMGIMPVHYAFSQVMQSPTYKMENDSINFGGGNSNSANYFMESSLGELGTGYSSSSEYFSHAGYQQIVEPTYITLSALTDLQLGSVGGFVGGVASGTHSWLVTTNNATGYTLTVKAATSPALTSGAASFADYVPAGPDPDFNFAITPTTSAFGFSPEGTDVIQRFKDNGSACNVGSLNTTNACWDGFSTTTKSVATRNSSNNPTGSTTTLKYRVETGASRMQEAGEYSAVITVTALTL